MGEYADYEIDRQIDWHLGKIGSLYRASLPPKGLWETKTGERIALVDMSDQHLRNTIAWCERNHPDSGWHAAKVEEMKAELESRETP